MKGPGFTVGIEEEYLLVDRQTRDLAIDPPPALMDALHDVFADGVHGAVAPEFLRSQVEVGTKVCTTVQEAAAALGSLRLTLAEVAGAHGLAPMAASTHPFAQWDRLKHTDKERYSVLANDLQTVVRRLVICGMHVHVGIEDPDLRLDLMNQVTYFLPHLLALSTSSPFWRGQDSGLKSYRVSVFNELPRTGLPEPFTSYTEYQRHVQILITAGLIEDSTKIWWDVRPSHRFPTLEMRITDVCTRLEDAVCIAAIFVCLTRMLYRLRRSNQRWRQYARMLVAENRWRAQRYGLDAGLVDFGRGEVVDFDDLVEEILDLISPDAAALGCQREVLHAREIIKRGTSAHNQLRVFKDAKDAGANDAEALTAVVDALVAATVAHGPGPGKGPGEEAAA